ncbi:MAG: class I SAM-dependent methyltransferase [Thaumarchaeota archaeon]|nr:class I SAM-dependent methyltransferase [Nitrososphaerota archaeon]
MSIREVSPDGSADGPESTETPKAPPTRASYGIDQPGAIIQLTAAAFITIVTGFVLSFLIPRSQVVAETIFLVGFPTIGFIILVVSISLYWSSRLGKPREIDRVLRQLPWGGSEIVVDVGCGRGLMTIAAAKRLVDGIAIGTDIWRARDLTGNYPHSVETNAVIEGVADKVIAIKSDARFLPFDDESVDVSMSSMVIHIIGRWSDRAGALDELIRITKPGGRIAIVDSGNGGDYAKFLRSRGITDIKLSRLRVRSFPPLHTLSARKPFSS